MTRRWRALSDDGWAWIWLKGAVAAALVAEPAIVSVSGTSGEADFLLDVFVPTLDGLTQLIDERIGPIEGIVSVTAMIALATFREGSRWRVQALDLHQSALLGSDARSLLVDPSLRSTTWTAGYSTALCTTDDSPGPTSPNAAKALSLSPGRSYRRRS